MTFLWRSLIYVPAHVEKFVTSPHIHAADAVILDLEDSVPADSKAGARAGLTAAVSTVGAEGCDVLVRINEDSAHQAADIVAAVQPGVCALVAPKVRNPAQVEALDALIGQAEAGAGIQPGTTRLLVLIETADGLLEMAAIARASARIVAMNIGNEDLALDLGMAVGEDTLAFPRQQMVIAAAAAGIMPLGLMGPATRFDDAEAYRLLAQRSRRFGHVGSTCIHPSQIAILNTAFAPAADELAWADRVLREVEIHRREGRGAFAIDGQMIDAPIISRAEKLRRHVETTRSD